MQRESRSGMHATDALVIRVNLGLNNRRNTRPCWSEINLGRNATGLT